MFQRTPASPLRISARPAPTSRRPSSPAPAPWCVVPASAVVLAAVFVGGTAPAMTQTSTAGPASVGYTGYSGTRWSTDYGIRAGRCDRDRIVVESNAAGRTLVQRHEENLKNRTVGIIGATGGTGVLLSTRVGGRLDERDRRCLGHVLELGAAGQQVGWTNGATRQTYAVVVTEYTPSGSVPSGARPGAKDRCRVLLLTTVAAGVAARGNTEKLIACEANPGVWSIR